MKKLLIILLNTSVASIALSCDLVCTGQQAAAQSQVKPAVLIELEGKDKLFYRTQPNLKYLPAFLNLELKPSYQLRLNQGGRAAIKCPGKSLTEPIIKDIPQGELTVANLGCPGIIKDIKGFLRGGENPNIPFIISPRNTDIVTDRPAIRWNALPDITDYQISLYASDEKTPLWSVGSSSVKSRLIPPSANFPLTSIEIEYPQDKPALQPGSNYRVVVTSEKEVSPVEECPDGWEKPKDSPFKCSVSSEDDKNSKEFKLLDSLMIEKLRKLEAQYQQRFQGEAQALALAHLFDENNLNMNAIQALENLVSQGNQSSGVYRFLGDLYLKSSLTPVAESFYKKAIILAKQAQDLSGQAAAQWGLAEALKSRGALSEARQVAIEAKDAYQIIGDEEQVLQIQQEVNQWQQ